MSRREFLQISGLMIASMTIPGCILSEHKYQETKENLENLPTIMLKSEWEHQVQFKKDIFYAVLHVFKIPYSSLNTVQILLTNETELYETDIGSKRYKVTASSDDAQNRISIACGSYSKSFEKANRRKPYTSEDALLFSKHLSMDIFSGMAYLTSKYDVLSSSETSMIAIAYADQLFNEDNSKIIFTEVFLSNKQEEFQASIPIYQTRQKVSLAL